MRARIFSKVSSFAEQYRFLICQETYLFNREIDHGCGIDAVLAGRLRSFLCERQDPSFQDLKGSLGLLLRISRMTSRA